MRNHLAKKSRLPFYFVVVDPDLGPDAVLPINTRRERSMAQVAMHEYGLVSLPVFAAQDLDYESSPDATDTGMTFFAR